MLHYDYNQVKSTSDGIYSLEAKLLAEVNDTYARYTFLEIKLGD